ncbi:MAG: hypothetical protein RR633_18245 [Acinetobacter sp.]
MAVPEQTPYIENTGNGVTKIFPIEFDVLEQDHLIVLVNDLEPSVGSWSLDTANNTVVFALPPANGANIKIRRDSPLSRSTDYESYNNSFHPKPVNDDLDNIWRKLQEMGVLNWMIDNNVKDLNEYVDGLNDETKAIFLQMIQEQGTSLERLDAYVDQLYKNLAEVSTENGWFADFVADGDENQKQINDLTIRNFESIQELLNYQPRYNGQTVYLKSYNLNQGEGGDNFVYKKLRQLENDGVSIFKGWERQKNGNPWTLEDAGRPKNSLSDSQYANKVFALSKSGHTSISLNPNHTYIFDQMVEVTDSKGITFNGNSTKMMIGFHEENPNDTYQYPFSISCDVNSKASVIIMNLRQDGQPSFYNPWEYFVQGRRWYSVVGIHIVSAFNVLYNNIIQENILGYGSQWFDCKNVSVEHFEANEVGGHNGLHGNDSLGDCFYIGWRYGLTNYKFKSIIANGVSVEDIYSGSYYSPRSRIFLTVENLAQFASDTITNITLENVYARNYQRGIHVEANRGGVVLNGNNVDILADLVCLSSHTLKGSVFSFINSKLTPNTKTYNGTGGINWGCDLYLGNGCIVDDVNRNSETEGVGLLSHGLGLVTKQGTILGKGSRVTNIKGILSIFGKYQADGATFEFSEAYDSYYNYMSAPPELINCELVNIENTKVKRISQDLAQFILKGCTTRNIDFSQGSYKAPASDLFLSTELPNYNAQAASGRTVNVYLDGVNKSLYDDVVNVDPTSAYTSANELVFEGKYFITKTLLNLPNGVTNPIIETSVYSKQGFSGYSDGLVQTLTPTTGGATQKRFRDINGSWSAWS